MKLITVKEACKSGGYQRTTIRRKKRVGKRYLA
jgi:hypothetical protein